MTEGVFWKSVLTFARSACSTIIGALVYYALALVFLTFLLLGAMAGADDMSASLQMLAGFMVVGFSSLRYAPFYLFFGPLLTVLSATVFSNYYLYAVQKGNRPVGIDV